MNRVGSLGRETASQGVTACSSKFFKGRTTISDGFDDDFNMAADNTLILKCFPYLSDYFFHLLLTSKL